MFVLKHAAILVVLLFLSIAACGQTTQCALKLADIPAAPELVGFALGMTTEQVKQRIPQVRFGATDDFGVSKTTINPDFDPTINKSTFPGVRSVSLDFLDGRVTSLWIGYDGSFKAQTVDDFVKLISQSLHLPETWAVWRIRGKQLRCDDFQLTVTMVSEGPSFRILDLKADETIAARREEKQEQKEALEAGADQDEQPVVIGDKRSKTYYPAACEASKSIAPANVLTFKSAADAEKAGYKPAKSCH